MQLYNVRHYIVVSQSMQGTAAQMLQPAIYTRKRHCQELWDIWHHLYVTMYN